MTKAASFTLERLFNAPPSLVWQTWTEPELISRWYGPGAETIIHQMEVRQGGLWLLEMKWGEKSMHQKGEYLQVEPTTNLVWLHSSTDSEWNLTPSPMMPDWPKIMHTAVTLEEQGDQTRMQLVWTPHEATEKEIACFTAAMDGLDSGWGAGMKLLAELLEEIQAE